MTLLNLDLRFITQKQFMILDAIDSDDDVYALQIVRITGITHKYVVDVLDELIRIGLVVHERVGRRNLLKLTKFGKEYLSELRKIHALLRERKIVKSESKVG